VRSNGAGILLIKGEFLSLLDKAFLTSFRRSLVIHSKLVVTPETVYAIGVAKSTASYTLHVTTLSTASGETIHSGNIGSSIADPLTQLTILTHEDLGRPIALWLEQGTLRYVGLTPTLKEKSKPLKGSGYSQLVDVGLGAHGQVVVLRKDSSSTLLKFEGESMTAVARWEFEDSVGH